MANVSGYSRTPQDRAWGPRSEDARRVPGGIGGTWLTEEMVRALDKEDLVKLAAANRLILSRRGDDELSPARTPFSVRAAPSFR